MVSPKLQTWLDENMPEGAAYSSFSAWPGEQPSLGWYGKEIGYVRATPDEPVVTLPVPGWVRAGQCPVCLDPGKDPPETTICFVSEVAEQLRPFLAQLEGIQQAASA